MTAQPDGGARSRLDVIDALRGLAVVFMIALHTSHGWLAPPWREGPAWSVIRSLGGMAAPLFLLLAGVSLGLGWNVVERNPDAQARPGIARGLGILVLGYVLRVQMWMLDANGYRDTRAWLVAGTLVVGYALVHRGLARWGVRQTGGAGWLAVGACAIAIGAWAVARWFPERAAGVFRVDVLQAIGASVALVAYALAALRGRRSHLAALGALVACATPLVEMSSAGALPAALDGYLVRRPVAPGVLAAGLFPLFPWAAYAFVGAALGLDWASAARGGGLARRIVVTGAFGVLLALASCELVPGVSAALGAQPWLTHPVRVAYRIGLALVFAVLCLALVRARFTRWPLVTFGRASLLVYWVHLEFAFGIAARPLARRLDLAHWAAWTFALVVAMGALAALASGVRRERTTRAMRRVGDDAWNPTRAQA